MTKLKSKVEKKNIVKEKDELNETKNNTDGDAEVENMSEDHAGAKKGGRGKKAVETEAASEETEATKGRKRAAKSPAGKTKKSKTDGQDANENISEEPESEDAAASDEKSQTINSTANKKGKQNRKSATKQQKGKKGQSKGEADYEVEDILEVRTNDSGTKEFLIKWKGYKKSDSTWEPEENLSCTNLIQEFYERTGSETSPRAGRKREAKSPASKAKKAKTVDQNKQNSRAASKSSRTKTPQKSMKGQNKPDHAEYEVEEVLDVAVKKGKKEFLIKWKGYDTSESSWEPEKNLSCKHLIEAFYEKSGKSGDEGKKAETDGSKLKQAAKAKGQKNKENDTSPVEYEVDKIVDMKTDKKGKKEFRIRWKGYGEDQDTWEPENMLSCKDLIDAFMASKENGKTKGSPKASAAAKRRNKKK